MAGTLIVDTCEFVTFDTSLNASGNLFVISCKFTFSVLHFHIVQYVDLDETEWKYSMLVLVVL